MTNLDFNKTPLVAPKPTKIFGTVDAPVDLAEAFGGGKTVKRALSALPQIPMRFYRDNLIACDGDDGRKHLLCGQWSRPQQQNFQTWCPQHRCLLSARRSRWLDGSETLSLNRSCYRHKGPISQTECVAVHRIAGKPGCKFFANRNNQ